MNWCNKLGFTCKIQFCVSSCFQFEAYPNKTGVCPHVNQWGTSQESMFTGNAVYLMILVHSREHIDTYGIDESLD